MEHRRKQVAGEGACQPTAAPRAESVPLCREFLIAPGESWESFRGRNTINTGLAEPSEMPYYVLLVGDPDAITYEFQHTLDLDRAVGRLYFGKSGDPDSDLPEYYERYAQSVIQAECGKLRLPRRTTFFGTAHDDDDSTQRSNAELVTPLLKRLKTDQAVPGWEINRVHPANATKDRLGSLLGGADTPSLLFTATHGAAFDMGDPLQARRQGALVTQDWSGLRNRPVRDTEYFSADDLLDMGDAANVWGLIAVFFACFGAGTPRDSEFIHLKASNPQEQLHLADRAMVSPLPQALLGHRNGGALGVVGHVERAWTDSFRVAGRAGDAGSDTKAMRNLLRLLMRGFPLGLALEDINSRYAYFSTQLTTQLFEIEKTPGLLELDTVRTNVSGLWTATNDARNYVILGDPAVRLPVGDEPVTGHTGFEPVSVRPPAAPAGPGNGQSPATVPAASAEAGTDAAAAGSHSSSSMSLGGGGEGGPAKVQALAPAGELSPEAGASGPQSPADPLRQAAAALEAQGDLRVATYTSPNLQPGDYDAASQQFRGDARLAALTIIRPNGDVISCLPEASQPGAGELAALHLQMVERARAGRAELAAATVARPARRPGWQHFRRPRMADYADLEIRLSVHSGNTYGVGLVLRQPDTDAITEPTAGASPLATLDPGALGAIADDGQAYGRALAAALFAAPEVDRGFTQARAAAAAQKPPVPLRVRLAIEYDARQLHFLRWETLRDPAQPNARLALDANLPFSRYIASRDNQAVGKRPPGSRLRALVVIANPAPGSWAWRP